MVMVNMLMKIGPPTKEEALVMTMASISPSQRGISLAESDCRSAKGPLPRFLPRESGASYRKVAYDFFSRVKHTI